MRQAVKIAVDAIWGLITIVIILGGILSGIFTPTESAAVAVVYSFFVTMFVYRDVKWRELPQLVARVVRTVGMVMIMIGFSIAFGYVMAIMRIPAMATEFFVSISSDKYTFLLYVNILLLLLGHVHGPRADAADLHADLPARDRHVRHRSRSLRDHHDPQSRHRPADPAGRADAWSSGAPSARSPWRPSRAAS